MGKRWLKALATLFALILIGVGSTLIIFQHSEGTSNDRLIIAPDKGISHVSFENVAFAAWAVQDRRTGAVIGSANFTAPSDTMSMVKAWIAADFLRDQTSVPDRSVLQRLSTMIRDSDNDIATEFHHRNGEAASIDRMVRLCRLTESHAGKLGYRWSDTVMSARDVARLGGCLADGRGAGSWTQWLLAQMRAVRGDGDFGPRLAFPAAQQPAIAIKNGWFERPEDDQWHYACLAIGGSWTLGVLIRYPADLGESHGRELCRAAGEQLLSTLS